MSNTTTSGYLFWPSFSRPHLWPENRSDPGPLVLRKSCFPFATPVSIITFLYFSNCLMSVSLLPEAPRGELVHYCNTYQSQSVTSWRDDSYFALILLKWFTEQEKTKLPPKWSHCCPSSYGNTGFYLPGISSFRAALPGQSPTHNSVNFLSPSLSHVVTTGHKWPLNP